MKRLTALLLVALLGIGLSGCVKMNSATDLKNDGSGTVKMSMGLKTEALETIKAQLEAMGEMGGEGMEQAQEAFDELEDMFDEKKLAAKLKESGLEVVSTKSSDEAGWKTLEIDAKFADVNAWLERSKKLADKESEDVDSPWEGMPMGDFGGMVPTFYKTKTPGVGQIVLIPPMKEAMAGMPMDPEELEELGDEELDMIEGQLDMMKAMFSINEMKMQMSFTVPGEVVETKGCKSKDRTLSFTFGGSDINVAGMKTLFGMKNGVSATFKIPEGCAIKFKDMPSANSEPAVTDEAEENDKKEKEKKGGLKIK